MRRIVFLVFAALVAAAPATASPILLNGSLTGPIDNDGVPSNWTILAFSPDTMDQNNNVGVAGQTDFGAVPVGPSPDGGTWVGIGTGENGFNESFAQTVAGFTTGATYTLSWYQGNFGFASLDYINPNALEVLINGVSVGSGALLPLGSLWTSTGLSFIAPEEDLQIAFRGLNTEIRSYISIDGIELTDTAPVPEPASLTLLGLGLVGMGARRWRQRKQ